MSRTQRLLVAGGVLATLIVLGVFVKLLATPEYKPLFTGLDPIEAQALGAKLAAKNIPSQISSDGKSVLVPSDKLDAARLEIASAGMPKTGRLGFELFDKVTWGQTEFDERVNYQRALEGELERTVQTVSGVESARIHIVLPTPSVFADREKHAKASVILKLSSRYLSESSREAIARLVSGAVDDLSPEDVTVIDADSNRPLGSVPDRNDPSNLQADLAARLLATINPVVGPDHVRVNVNVEYDPSSMDEQQETYDPNSAVAITTQRSEERLGNSAKSGVPGTASNLPTSRSAVTASASPDNSQYAKTENTTYAVNKVVRRTINPAGRIRRISAAVLVDDAPTQNTANGKTASASRKRTPEELAQIADLAKASIGADTTRGDVVTVQNISFEASPSPTPYEETRIKKIGRVAKDWSWLIRYGALLVLFVLVYALLLRPLKKQMMNALALSKPSSARNELSETSTDQLTPEQQKIASTKKQLIERAKTDPEATSRLIRAWIHEDAR